MVTSESTYWQLIHAERNRLAALLRELDHDQWQSPSLCADWTVEQVVAHLSAAATTGQWAWLRSIIFAGFNPARHNNRRLAHQRGSTPAETLQRYIETIPLKVAPTADYAAWLGEVIVHGQDIARPLGLSLNPDPTAVEHVAGFYAAKNFAVKSHSAIKGLRLHADDADFAYGEGTLLSGTLLDLVMAMAGRADAFSALAGPGLEQLRQRHSSA